MVRVGLVGVGRWGQQHIDAAQVTPGCDLVALAARSPESCAAAQAKYNLPAFSDYSAFLAQPEIEAVIIAAPNFQHYAMAKAALEAGKHVLLEKPMAFSVTECDALIAAADKSGKVLFIGHEFRQFAIWREVKRLLDEGAIGRPLFGSLQLWRYPYSSGSGGWRRDPAQVGNWLLEEPVHYFDLALWFMAGIQPTTLYTQANSRSAETAAFYENFTALLNFENGAYLEIMRSVVAHNFEINIRFTGTDGYLRASWYAETDRSREVTARISLFQRDVTKQTVPSEGQFQEVPVTQQTGHAFELKNQTAAFVQAVQDGKPAVSGLDGRRAVALCEASLQSFQQKRPVTLENWL